MGENRCDGCPNYQKNPYSRRFECYGNCCEVETRADERKKVLDEVISVLVDLGYGDEENGAEWAYMVALYDVARRIKQLKGEQT